MDGSGAHGPAIDAYAFDGSGRQAVGRGVDPIRARWSLGDYRLGEGVGRGAIRVPEVCPLAASATRGVDVPSRRGSTALGDSHPGVRQESGFGRSAMDRQAGDLIDLFSERTYSARYMRKQREARRRALLVVGCCCLVVLSAVYVPALVRLAGG